MSNNPLDRLIGGADRDPGCDAAFEQFDRYCEAVRRGDDVTREFADFCTHIRNCAACREDTEGLLLALERLEGNQDP